MTYNCWQMAQIKKKLIKLKKQSQRPPASDPGSWAEKAIQQNIYVVWSKRIETEALNFYFSW